jgi:hypothetical protein
MLDLFARPFVGGGMLDVSVPVALLSLWSRRLRVIARVTSPRPGLPPRETATAVGRGCEDIVVVHVAPGGRPGRASRMPSPWKQVVGMAVLFSWR